MSTEIFIVATPIGNIQDLTLRATEVLNYVDVIFAEDTRVTSKLLNHYAIKKTLVSFNDHNESTKINLVKKYLDNDKNIALVSDAGTPLISDPGYKLIKHLANTDKYKITPIPGACAFIAALSAAGVATDEFYFIGFLPTVGAKRINKLTKSLTYINNCSLIFYESARRLIKLLDEINSLKPDCFIVVAKEITKIHEAFIRGSANEIKDYFLSKPSKLKGEMVLLIDKENLTLAPEDDDSFQPLINDLKTHGLSAKDISVILSRNFPISKNKVYNLALQLKDKV